ncbi:MAG: phosphoribosylformylglycinamidine synthase [Deltaproteobacteria bacterium]|nr:phosphoribosylformylglycinamidine synthase [Deltaproteobacteria bacterium]
MRAHRIEVGLREGFADAVGERLCKRIQEQLGIPVEQVRCVDVYTLDVDLTDEQLAQVAAAPYCDPVVQRSSVDAPLEGGFEWAVEISLRPGVTDNVGRTAREAAALALDRPFGPGEGVYHARQMRLRGALERDGVERIARELLANELIQQIRVLDASTFAAGGGFEPLVPAVVSRGRPAVARVSLDLDDEALQALSRERVWALSLDELRAVRAYYRRESVCAQREACGLSREPTDVEIEALAQTWSEHCKHKIFNARIQYREGDGEPETIDSLFDTCVRAATEVARRDKGERDLCQSVFSDNAGVFRFDEEYSLVCKVETHNSPSALDPYGGALTGIVGVNRDPFGTGMGARLIFNTDVFCFASPYRTQRVPRPLLHPRRVLEGVREGVEHGGNKSGIPTVNGSVVFDERFLGKPLVFCGTGGLLPARLHGRPGWEKECRSGDRIVMAGGRIGADGIHGATFSSEELHEGSPSTAVQIGDPITQKRLTDFLLRARDEGLYRAITDNGAGGLSSSVGEMAESAGGCDLDLTSAPLKYEGLAAWEILLSEAQERMTLAVPPEKKERFFALASRYQVEVCDLGCFTDDGLFRVRDHGETVALLEMDFLHHGLPRMELEARWSPPDEPEQSPALPEHHGALLLAMLGRLNICSKHYWVRQYDHEVQAGSVIKPLTGADDDGPSDAAVLRPRLDSLQAVAVSHGICPRYSDLDARAMAECAVDEALRNAVAVGADPDRAVGLDNFCWCDPIRAPSNPDGDFKLGQLVRACRGLHDTCVAYGVACISGKDSMKNDAVIEGLRISIPPTLLFSLLGLLDDARQAVSMDFKAPGEAIYALGTTRAELGGSEYYAQAGGRGGRVPRVRPAESLRLYRALHRAIEAGCVSACHDCADGGLGVALAESVFAGGLGAEVSLAAVPAEGVARDDALLYAESAGRFIAGVPRGREAEFEALLDGCACARIGEVIEKRLRIRGLAGETILDEPADALKAAWLAPLDW